MFSIESVFSVFLIVWEVFCERIFFDIFCTRKERGRYGYIIENSIIFVLSLVISIVFSDYFVAKEILILILLCNILYYCYAVSVAKMIGLSIGIISIFLGVETLVITTICNVIPKVAGIIYTDVAASILLSAACHLFVYLVLILIKILCSKHNKSELTVTEWLQFSLFPVTTMVMVITIVCNWEIVKNGIYGKLLIVFSMTLVIMNFVMYSMVHNILKRETVIRYNQINNEKIISEMHFYDEQKRRTHEYKNQIECMAALYADHKYDELGKYLGELIEGVEKQCIRTGNAIVDAIINNKYNECRKKGILLIMDINNLEKVTIDYDRMVIILSNILNNAIEASQDCDVKRIYLTMIYKDNALGICVKNNYSKKPVVEKGLYISNKTDDMMPHGIGLQNVERAIKDLDGVYDILIEEQFIFSAVIPMP